MGICSSQLTPEEKELQRRSKLLEQRQKEDQERDAAYKKLLLLGAGESGKSTLFKQMIALYGKGYSEEDRKTFVAVVHNNCIDAIRTLVNAADKLGIPITDPNSKAAASYVCDTRHDNLVDRQMADQITTLWRDSNIQSTYSQRAKFQLMDSAQYFFDKLDEICDKNYLPSQQDVLRTRVRTTGIVETDFEIEDSQFKMFDVGGQRNERKKWIHCFEKVTAIIFVAAISEYDQVLYEDETTNRLHEALDLFGEITNSRWFTETSIILFLNKRDLLQIKIKKVPITICFEDYDGPNTYEAACEFFQACFEEEYEGDKEIYSHCTCATDTENISHVFNSVKDIIIRGSLQDIGVM